MLQNVLEWKDLSCCFGNGLQVCKIPSSVRPWRYSWNQGAGSLWEVKLSIEGVDLTAVRSQCKLQICKFTRGVNLSGRALAVAFLRRV